MLTRKMNISKNKHAGAFVGKDRSLHSCSLRVLEFRNS